MSRVIINLRKYISTTERLNPEATRRALPDLFFMRARQSKKMHKKCISGRGLRIFGVWVYSSSAPRPRALSLCPVRQRPSMTPNSPETGVHIPA